MVDQYYSTTLPQLLQELDDVYHDVSAVVAETIIQGADVISLKVRSVSIHTLSIYKFAPLNSSFIENWLEKYFYENKTLFQLDDMAKICKILFHVHNISSYCR